jgi:Rhodopirellula transposase DDE domain
MRSSATSTRACAAFRRGASPAISVDTKKKELVGDFKIAGREWRPDGEPEEVRVHDFVIRGQGTAIPYAIYDLARQRRVFPLIRESVSDLEARLSGSAAAPMPTQRRASDASPQATVRPLLSRLD